MRCGIILSSRAKRGICNSAVTLLLVAAGCAPLRTVSTPTHTGVVTRNQLVQSIDSMVNAPEFRNANWGILIVDPSPPTRSTRTTRQRSSFPRRTRSSSAARCCSSSSGPNYRFRTTIAARGAIAEQMLNGDLVVIGRGDPTASDHMKGDAMVPLREIADSVWQRGIRRITGRVVADGNAFPGPVAGFGWPWDHLDGTSFAGVDELLFNEGLSTIRVRPGATRATRRSSRRRPARTYPSIRSLATTVARDRCRGRRTRRREAEDAVAARAPRAHGSRSTTTPTPGVVVRGQIALGDSATSRSRSTIPTLRTSPRSPKHFATRHRGRRRHPRVTQRHTDSLFTVLSVPLREILPMILKPSQNQIAEVFLRTIGLERTGIGTADSGRRVIERQFADWKIQPDGFVVRDGSGLSRSDLISPEAVVGILDVMRRSPNFNLFYESLPIAGVDGTIRTRMKDTPAEGTCTRRPERSRWCGRSPATCEPPTGVCSSSASSATTGRSHRRTSIEWRTRSRVSLATATACG